MKIIHRSDLHLGTIFKRGNIRKTRHLIEQAVEDGFDHMVISGDISDNGKASDFKLLKNITGTKNYCRYIPFKIKHLTSLISHSISTFYQF